MLVAADPTVASTAVAERLLRHCGVPILTLPASHGRPPAPTLLSL